MLDTTNYIGDASGHESVGVMLPSTGVAGQIFLGILMETAKAGGTAARLRPCAPTAVGIAHSTVTVGTIVDGENASGHEGQVITHVSGKPQLGLALSQASDGDPVLVLLLATGADNA